MCALCSKLRVEEVKGACVPLIMDAVCRKYVRTLR